MPDTKTDSRSRMIYAATDLFHRKGINATGLNEVLKASNTGKGQFTHYFRNKNGLIRAVIRHLFENVRSGQALASFDIKSWEDFECWFNSSVNYQKSVCYTRSCPIGTIGSELLDSQEVIREDIDLFLEWSRSKFYCFFSEKKAAGELGSSAAPEELADLCMCVLQGGMLITKIRRNPKQFENAARQVVQFVRSMRCIR